MDLAFGVFSDSDKVEEANWTLGTIRMKSTITGGSPDPCTTSELPSLTKAHGMGRVQKARISHCLAKKVSKCGQEEHCKDECLLYGKSPLGPCLILSEGHWKWDWPGTSVAAKRKPGHLSGGASGNT